MCGALMESLYILTDGKEKKATFCKKKEHPFGCSLHILWDKFFKVYSFAGHFKTVCKDISSLRCSHQYFEQMRKLSTTIQAGKGFLNFHPANTANNQQTKISSQLRGLHTFVCSFGGFLIEHPFVINSDVDFATNKS